MITDGRQDAKEGPKDGSELRTEDSNKVSANNEDGKGGKGNSVDASLRRRSGRERIASRGPLLSSSIFQRDMATATAKSREETPFLCSKKVCKFHPPNRNGKGSN